MGLRTNDVMTKDIERTHEDAVRVRKPYSRIVVIGQGSEHAEHIPLVHGRRTMRSTSMSQRSEGG